MQTETREERTPNTPLVADCLCKVSSFLWTARHYSSPPLMVAAQGGYGGGKVRLWWMNGYLDGRLRQRLNLGRKLGVWGWKAAAKSWYEFLA
ncbi:hypothetical protein PS1_025918 [Malus domestica]